MGVKHRRPSGPCPLSMIGFLGPRGSPPLLRCATPALRGQPAGTTVIFSGEPVTWEGPWRPPPPRRTRKQTSDPHGICPFGVSRSSTSGPHMTISRRGWRRGWDRCWKRTGRRWGDRGAGPISIKSRHRRKADAYPAQALGEGNNSARPIARAWRWRPKAPPVRRSHIRARFRTGQEVVRVIKALAEGGPHHWFIVNHDHWPRRGLCPTTWMCSPQGASSE